MEHNSQSTPSEADHSATPSTSDAEMLTPTVADRVRQQGPWDQIETSELLQGAPSLPMPVQIASPESLSGCFNHLRVDGQFTPLDNADFPSEAREEPYYDVPFVEYEKGVIYADRRLDLCKMVVGPLNIDSLMDSLEGNTFVKHFLLGNNIIGPAGARRIAKFIADHPERMDTWYLAGNCIDDQGFRKMVDNIVEHNSLASNIWLKRNPLGPSSASDAARLLIQSSTLDTLDLDQTELGDEGVAELFDHLTAALCSGSRLSLRHIYLNAVGVGQKAATAIGNFLGADGCQLESLFMSNNSVGDAGAEKLALALARNNSLRRLMMASTGLTSIGAKAIFDALAGHPQLQALDLGQSFATTDLGGRYNYIDDQACMSLIKLLHNTSLKYLVADHLAMSHPAMNQLYAALLASSSICWLKVNTITPTTGSNEVVRARSATSKLLPLLRSHLQANVKRNYEDMDYRTFETDEKRWLASPKEPVRKIDSVYRNRDAGLARRGLKKLDKWWDVDDVTLDEVMAS